MKVAKIRSYGAQLVVGGDLYADALEASRRHADASGALQIHAYDAVETLLGQGTVGLELDRQAPDLRRDLLPVQGAAGVDLAPAVLERELGVEVGLHRAH